MILACTSSISWWKLSPVPGCALCSSVCPKLFPEFTSSSRCVVNCPGKLSVVSRAEPSFSSESKAPTQQGCGTLTGAIVALGKFDALHIGHRSLAEQASKMGAPVLLSFTGMAQVLGWEKRLPIVAPSDRARVMSLWSIHCGGQTPSEHSLEFGSVRHLSPSEFVRKLAAELQVRGVVAGENYRFGYKAAGDAAELRSLCGEWGLDVFIVSSVMDDEHEFEQQQAPPEATDKKDRGQVSSTRVRKALARGNMKRVNELLGRNHRVLVSLADASSSREEQLLKLKLSESFNQHPGPGSYHCSVAFQGFGSFAGNGAPVPALCPCVVEISDEDLVLRGVDYSLRGEISQSQGYAVIEF